MSKSNQNTRLAALKLAVKLADRAEDFTHETAGLVVDAATKFEEFVQAPQQVITLTGEIGLSNEPLRIALENNMNGTNEHNDHDGICEECAKLNEAMVAAGFPSLDSPVSVLGLNENSTALLIENEILTFNDLLETHPIAVLAIIDEDQRDTLAAFMNPVSDFLRGYHGIEENAEGSEGSDSVLNDPELESLAAALTPAALNSKDKSTSGYGQLLLSDFSNLSSETTAFLAGFGVRTVSDFAYNPVAILKAMQLLPKPQTAKLLGHAITCMESDSAENPAMTATQKEEIKGRLDSLRNLVSMMEMLGQMAALFGEPETEAAPAEAVTVDPVKNARVKELLTHFGADAGNQGAVMVDIKTPEGAELITLMQDPASGFESQQVGEPREYASREEAQQAAREIFQQRRRTDDPAANPLIQAIAAMLRNKGRNGPTLH